MTTKTVKYWSPRFSMWLTQIVDSELCPDGIVAENQRRREETRAMREYHMSLIPKRSVNNPK
jgi:hypothetical protein